MSSTLRRLLGDALAQRLLGPGLWALFIKLASAGFSYVMLVAFARMMNGKSYGEFGMLLNLAIVMSTVAALGLPTGVMRFWSGYIARGEPALAAGFHRSAQHLLLASSALLTMAFVALSLGGVLPLELSSTWLTLLVALLFSGFALSDYYGNALRAQGRVLSSMIPRDVLWRVLAPTLAALMLWWRGELTTTAALLSCVCILLGLTLFQAWASNREARAATGPVTPIRRWSAWRKPLVPLAAASILYAMVQQLDVVVVGSLVGQAEAGAYFAAQKTASLLGLVMIAGGLVAAPMMSAAFQGGDTRQLQKICKLLSAAIAVTTGLGFIVLLVTGKLLLAIFDPSYQNAYWILVILALGYGVDALAGPTAYLMQMTSLEGSYLRVMAIVYGFVLALQLALVPHYGAIAAAIATAIGVCLWNILSVYYLRKTIGVDSSILSFFLPPQKPNKPEP